MQKRKYSLWIVPEGQAGQALQELVDGLATQYETPFFVPHITLVADILATENEIGLIASKVETLARQTTAFQVSLSDYGYTAEEFRCLYLHARSLQLISLYNNVASIFPQVKTEDFRQMPHLSVMYGSFPEAVKKQIVQENPLPAAGFLVESISLYITDEDPAAWRPYVSFRLQAGK